MGVRDYHKVENPWSRLLRSPSLEIILINVHGARRCFLSNFLNKMFHRWHSKLIQSSHSRCKMFLNWQTWFGNIQVQCCSLKKERNKFSLFYLSDQRQRPNLTNPWKKTANCQKSTSFITLNIKSCVDTLNLAELKWVY